MKIVDKISVWFIKRYFLGLKGDLFSMKKYKIGSLLRSRFNKVKWIVSDYLKKEDVYIMKTENGEMKDRVPADLMERYYIK